jgi:8-oxo-dGTP pyrophosphatase MutT (NUDIX family)
MEKFSKLGKKKKVKTKNQLLHDLEYMKIYSRSGWVYVEEPDNICVLPIIIEDNQILVRMEVIPSFQSRDNQDFHLTCISGTIDGDEKPETCLIRELEEEAGIRLKENFEFEFFDVLYKSKSQSSKFHLCILPIHIYEFTEVKADGDGSVIEKESKTVKVSVDNIDNLFPSDIVTRLLLEECKKYLDI